MSDRKLSSVEVKSEIVARDMQTFLQERYDEGEYPLPVMLGLAELRYLSLRIARVEKDLATERRLHRETEKRAETMKVERDVARRERDQRPDIYSHIGVATGHELDALAPIGIYRGAMSDSDFRHYLKNKNKGEK